MGLFYDANAVIATDQLNRRNVMYAAFGSAVATMLLNGNEPTGTTLLAATAVGSLVAATYWSLTRIRDPVVVNLYDIPIEVHTMAELLQNATKITQDQTYPDRFYNDIGNYYYPYEGQIAEVQATGFPVYLL